MVVVMLLLSKMLISAAVAVHKDEAGDDDVMSANGCNLCFLFRY